MHTTDMDFGTWSTFADYNRTEAMKLYQDGMALKIIYGFPENLYEQAYYAFNPKKLFWADLFFVYPEKDRNVVSLHIIASKGVYPYYMEKFTELCSSDLFGYIVHIPCDPIPVIKSDYGVNWTQPSESHGLGKNYGEFYYWPPDKVNQSYQNFYS